MLPNLAADSRRVSSRAHRIHAYGGPEVMQVDEVAIPTYADNDVLVQVMAAGINAMDWKIRDGLFRQVRPVEFPATLGFEFAGIVVGVGRFVSTLMLGDHVFAPLAGMGAYADFVTVPESQVSRTPDGLLDVEAAAIPIAALTAWQALEAAGTTAGSTVVIHGAAGGVGSFATQFAKRMGAKVLATASATSRAHVLRLGADQVLDYKAEPFERKCSNADVVLDLVGRDLADRSSSILRPGGVIVSPATPNLDQHYTGDRRALGIQMHGDPERLLTIARDVCAGCLKNTISAVVSRSDMSAAIERAKTGHAPGKAVVDFTS